MTKQYAAFIRHGDYFQINGAPSAYQPFPLTEDGVVQAREAADELSALAQKHNFAFDPVINCSTLLRAWQTAEIIRQNLDGIARISSFDALAERSVGAVANLDVHYIEEILEVDPRFEAPPQNWKSNSHYRLPFIGAESLMDAGKRVAEHIKKSLVQLKSDDGQKRLKLFVGHGAAFRHAAHHLGVLRFEEIERLSMYHAKPIVFEQLENDKWQHVAGHWKQRKTTEEYTD